jgi:hypothetical protein
MKTPVCPELVEADIRALRGHSGFEPIAEVGWAKML